MKNYLFSALLLLLLNTSCVSLKHKNSLVDKSVPADKLKKDVDFVYSKLQKLQPALYWYIDKGQLDQKFDSLKTTITKPLTSFEFYEKITPVLNEIRQGHLGVYPNSRIYTKKESKEMAQKGMGPFSQFEFKIFENKLYVTKNNSIDSTINVGSEVVSINNVATQDLLKKYRKLVTSDGFNTTFYNHQLAKKFSTFYVYENGINDSLNYQFKFNDSIKSIWIKRKKMISVAEKSKDSVGKKSSKAENKKKLAALKSKRRHNNIHGFDEITKTYQRSLKFIESDSSVAVLKIKSFSIGSYEPFYEEAFKKIKDNKSKTLILDLRGNPGGRLSEINQLYSFLSDSAIAFADRSELASKTSFFKRKYFGGGLAANALKTVAYPFYASYILLKVKKEDDKYYFRTKENKIQTLPENRFTGKMYVLIDGGSFSASSIISSNLKGSKRAVFVGEETGGAFNGTVAGQMPILELPHSRVKVRIGLMKIAAHYKTDEEGHGIRPDIEIIPTLEDKINGNDPEMNWILNDIKQTSLDAN